MAQPATTVRKPRHYRDEVGGKFRIVVGVHFGDGPPGCDCDACYNSDGKNHVYEARGATHKQIYPPEYTGDIIESKQDLCARYNAGPHAVKFERVYEPNPVQAPPAQQQPMQQQQPQQSPRDAKK